MTEALVSDALQYQLRVYLVDELIETARFNPNDPALRQLSQILQKHSASMKCQFDAFAEYVAEAERQGTAQYPLYEWTRATIEDPEKKKKHLRSFSLHVNGREVYSSDEADGVRGRFRQCLCIRQARLSRQSHRWQGQREPA